MTEPALFFGDLAAEAKPVARGIHSQTLYDGPDLRLVLFAFAPGEELSEHTAARPAVVHVLDGEGDAVVGDDARPLPFRAAGLLTPGETVGITAGARGVKLLLLAGKPIGEPVVQYGPFVMNTVREIERAIVDYQSGRLAVAS